MRISDWSSDVCSSDLLRGALLGARVGFGLVGGEFGVRLLLVGGGVGAVQRRGSAGRCQCQCRNLTPGAHGSIPLVAATVADLAEAHDLIQAGGRFQGPTRGDGGGGLTGPPLPEPTRAEKKEVK